MHIRNITHHRDVGEGVAHELLGYPNVLFSGSFRLLVNGYTAPPSLSSIAWRKGRKGKMVRAYAQDAYPTLALTEFCLKSHSN